MPFIAQLQGIFLDFAHSTVAKQVCLLDPLEEFGPLDG